MIWYWFGDIGIYACVLYRGVRDGSFDLYVRLLPWAFRKSFWVRTLGFLRLDCGSDWYNLEPGRQRKRTSSPTHSLDPEMARNPQHPARQTSRLHRSSAISIHSLYNLFERFVSDPTVLFQLIQERQCSIRATNQSFSTS